MELENDCLFDYWFCKKTAFNFVELIAKMFIYSHI